MLVNFLASFLFSAHLVFVTCVFLVPEMPDQLILFLIALNIMDRTSSFFLVFWVFAQTSPCGFHALPFPLLFISLSYFPLYPCLNPDESTVFLALFSAE